MDVVEFAEQVLGLKLLNIQKQIIRKVSKDMDFKIDKITDAYFTNKKTGEKVLDCSEYFAPNLTDEEKKDLKEKSGKRYGLSSETLYIDEFIGTSNNKEE